MSSFRNRHLMKEGFTGAEEAEVIVAPSQVAIVIDEALGLRTEIEAEANSVSEISEVIEVAEEDAASLDSMEESLEDESREVTEEEAETIKLVTEGFSRRYGFDMPRTLGTESFSADRDANRKLALQYVQAARLGTENFIKDAFVDLENALRGFFNVLESSAESLRKFGGILRMQDRAKVTGKAVGDTLFYQIYSNLTYDREYKGTDIEWLRKFAKANLDCSGVSFEINEGYTKELVAFLEKNPGIDNDYAAICKGVPALDKFVKSQEASFKDIGLNNTELPILGHAPLSIKNYAALGIIAFFFMPHVVTAAIITAYAENKMIERNSKDVQLITGQDFIKYGDLMISIADQIKSSKLVQWSSKGGQSDIKRRLEAHEKFIEASSLNAASKKAAMKVVGVDRRAMALNLKVRVANMRSMATGLVSLARLSIKA